MSEHLVEMDDEYAKLSLYAGMFARAADEALGTNHFISMIRQHAWSLTWEKLAAWKAEAIAMGIPAKDLEPDPDMIKGMPWLIEYGKRLQHQVDTANPDGIVH
jgi:hypothetical protein